MVGKKYLVLFILGAVLAFGLRILLSPYGNHWDLHVNSDWSRWIYFNGTHGFYESKVWIYTGPSQFPLVNLIYGFNYAVFEKILGISRYWFSFGSWFSAYYQDTSFRMGQFISMKLIPIFTDIAIGIVIFLLGSKYINKKVGFLTSLLYLFIPCSFYISSLWGQYDQLSALCLLLSFCFIYMGRRGGLKNWYFPLSVIFYFIAFEIKPTAAFTIPFYIYYILKQKPKPLFLIMAFLTGLGLFLITTMPFVIGNPFSYTINTIIPIVYNQDRNITSTHAFNLWGLVSPLEQSSVYSYLFGIGLIWWGFLFLAVLNVFSIFLISKKNDLEKMLLGVFIITGGSYIFATGMLDRYYFTGLLFFLILTMFYKKTLVLWLAAALLFSLDLFFSWGYPLNFSLPGIFWTYYPLVRILSLLQVALFVLMVKVCLE
jgi:hypothetical protein